MTRLSLEHLAKLSRLDLDAHEISVFEGQLDRVMTLIDSIRSLDLPEDTYDAAPPLCADLLRDDEAHPGLGAGEAIANAPAAAREQFSVPRVLDVD